MDPMEVVLGMLGSGKAYCADSDLEWVVYGGPLKVDEVGVAASSHVSRAFSGRKGGRSNIDSSCAGVWERTPWARGSNEGRVEMSGVPPVEPDAAGESRSASKETESEGGDMGLSESSPLW